MNIVLILTDQQCKYMVGAYGRKEFDTPNLDRLAARGMRFERAYTASPVCTAARASLMTGLTPQLAGAWANEMTVARGVPMMGEVFRSAGYRAGYTGKWHLDGTSYEGTGVAGGGFEPDWWFDRVNLIEELPEGLWQKLNAARDADDLRAAGLRPEHLHAHRVADRAVDFLHTVGDEPFVLVASFDEPHTPWLAPPEYWEKFQVGDIAARPNYNAPLDGKPLLQQIYAREIGEDHGHPTWEQWLARRRQYFGSNSYVDREIGRVLAAIEELHGDDTYIIYSSDHGDQLGSHGAHDKGAMMYEESCNVPFIVSGPEVPAGTVAESPVSQLDVFPTMLELGGIERPPSLHGRSLVPTLHDPTTRVNDFVYLSFNRFGLGQARGRFWPIRCITDGDYKLAINLFDTDELYDLATDPYEMTNRIDDPVLAPVRDAMHDRLLQWIGDTLDPMDSHLWGSRPWRTVGDLHYVNRPGEQRHRPPSFASPVRRTDDGVAGASAAG